MENKEVLKMFHLENNHFWFVGKRLFIKTLLDKYLTKKNLKILDVGCGTGGLTKFLFRYGDVLGLEINPVAIKLASRRGLKIIQGDAQKLPFPDKNFDLVTMLDVLYHQNVLDEKEAIDEVWRVLKKGGYLLITDSAFQFLKSKHDEVMGGKRRFVLNDLTEILINLNFTIIKKSYLFFSIFPLLLFKRKFLNFLIKDSVGSDVANINPFVNQLLILLMKFEAMLFKFISFPFGSSLIILARKR